MWRGFMRKRSRERGLRLTTSAPNGDGSRSSVVKMSRDQILESLEKGARQRTGLSAQVMLRRYRHGRLAGPSRVTDLIALSNLLRKNDPILAK